MVRPRLENYLKTYRRKSGLTQSEVAFLLGWKNGAQLSRYEKRHTLPPLRTALACEAIFGVPAGELFAGLRKSVGREVSSRIGRLDTDFRKKKGLGRQGRPTARKLSWLSERHGPDLSRNI